MNRNQRNQLCKVQLTCCQKVRALTLRECNWTQEEVAADIGMNVKTIQRLEKDAALQEDGKDEVPMRKPGSVSKRSFRKKQIEAVEELKKKMTSLG